MKRPINIIILACCVLIVLSLSGCAALLAIPAEIIGGTFRLIGQVLQVVSRMPMPPPGVF